LIFRAIERKALNHEPRCNGERFVTRREADALIAFGGYRASTGSPATARHWRRSLADGSCLHLVIQGCTRRLHHDTFDPHANLLSLLMHMSHEARSEAAVMAAVAWSAVSLLAD
jgi:hypothetical protein